MTDHDDRRDHMRLDLVTGPVRYRSFPLLGLLVAMAIPTLLLGVLLVWSDRQADAYEASQDGVADVVDAPSAESPPTPPLATSMFTYRRAPQQVAALAADLRLADAMAQLYVFVEQGSCVAVGVDGRTVSTRFPDDSVIPASTHKLLIAAVALETLGADHRFTTTVRATPAVDGVVDGDMYLVGGGDPLLTSDDYPIDEDRQPAFNTTSLDTLADAVAAAGITSIRGSIIGDGTRYDDEWSIPSWGPGVAGVDAGPYDALLVNDARVRYRSGRQRDPNEAAAREFARLLADRGVYVNNGWDSGPVPGESAGIAEIASVQSAPLTDVLAEMLTTSDNDTAEMLLKEVGFADSGLGTVGAGLDVVARTLPTFGVPMDGVQLYDASGLSAQNQVTCTAMLALLDHLAGTPIVDGLPVAGRTGTLTDEFVGSPVEGRLTAKTGTLGNPPDDLDPPAVKSLAGYLEAADGSTIAFAMLLNGDGISEPDGYRPYWDALAVRLADYPTGPDVGDLGPVTEE